MNEQWEVSKSDVLIVGGGFGGLWSAIKAAENGASVTLVEKSFAGKCGHSYFAGGAMQVLLPDDNLDEQVLDITLGNDWLVDQKKVEAIFSGSFDRLKDLESFGVEYRKKNNKYDWTKARGTRNVKNVWPEHSTGADIATILRKVALGKGVDIVNHVYIYALIKGNSGRIAGVIGIGTKNKKNYLLKAKATILATNSGGFRGHHLASELQGTGPFMAYEAGAAIKNPEFHYYNIRPAKHEIEGSGILPAIGAKWINAKKEFYMADYDPELKDRAPTSKIVVAAAKEALKGNAPLSINVEGMTEEERERFSVLMVSHGWQPILFAKCKREEGYDILRDNIEWQPAYESNKLGIDTDLNGRTSIEGLFAAGMARTLGINPFTGWSIMATTWSGHVAGDAARKYAKGVDYEEINLEYLNKRKKVFFAPLNNEATVDPDALVYKLQKIMFPADVLIIMTQAKLEEALSKVVELKNEQMPHLHASDIKTLIKTKEVQTMLLAAEMSLEAALMRKETRANIYYREDYHEPDNEKWLKWILVNKGEKGEMVFSTRDIPFDQYKHKPVI